MQSETEEGLMAGIRLNMKRGDYADLPVQNPNFADSCAVVCGLLLMVASALAMVWAFYLWPLPTFAASCGTGGGLLGLHVALRVIEP